MTNELSVRTFCNDTRVQSVLYYKRDGSIQPASCYCQNGKRQYEEKCQQQDTIDFDDVVLVARFMLGGAIDYPYASRDVVSQTVKTTIEVTTRSCGKQEYDPVHNIARGPDLAPCEAEPRVAANGEQREDFPDGGWRIRRQYYLPEGPQECEVESLTMP